MPSKVMEIDPAVWVDGLEELFAQVGERIGSVAGVLAVDDTGFEKKGRRSAGVQRQYTGTAGKITNCQIGVFCSYVNPDKQRVLIDRELYLPESWFADPARLADAGVAAGTVFSTKPELAWRMIERACDDPLLVFGWVTGDEAYGDNTELRRRCHSRGANYVFAVSRDQPLQLAGVKTRADHAFATLDGDAWQRYSCGDDEPGEEPDDLATQGARNKRTITPSHRKRRRSRRTHPAHRQRDPPPARPPEPAPTPCRPPDPLVTMATTSPSPSPPLPLPTPAAPHRSLNAAGVLVVRVGEAMCREQ